MFLLCGVSVFGVLPVYQQQKLILPLKKTSVFMKSTWLCSAVVCENAGGEGSCENTQPADCPPDLSILLTPRGRSSNSEKKCMVGMPEQWPSLVSRHTAHQRMTSSLKVEQSAFVSSISLPVLHVTCDQSQRWGGYNTLTIAQLAV